MGRRKGNPVDQAAMGYPGKRKSKTERAIAEAERKAKPLALPRPSDDAAAAPAYLADPRLATARAVWDEYAPRLDKLHLLAQLDRHTLALFCVYAGEFVIANEDILANSYSAQVKTISGDRMPRENPSAWRRDHAAKIVNELSSKFGLTTSDRNKLLSAGAMLFDDETLFGCASRPTGSAPGRDHEPVLNSPIVDPQGGGGNLKGGLPWTGSKASYAKSSKFKTKSPPRQKSLN